MKAIKNFLRFAGIVTAVLAIVAWILMMATPAVVTKIGSTTTEVAGTTAIFGAETKIIGSLSAKTELAWTALIAWILILLAVLAIVAGIVLTLLKMKGIAKIAGLANLISAIVLIVSAIISCVTVPTFLSANGAEMNEYTSLGGGWIAAGIIAIVGGLVSCAPAVVGLISKK